MPKDTQRGLLKQFAVGVCYTETNIDADVCDVICAHCLARAPLYKGYRGVEHADHCLVSRARAVLARSKRKDTP